MCSSVQAGISDSDCCGNGCANCILDSKPLSTRADLSNKTNVLLNYRKYKLIKKVQLLHHVLQLRFTIVDKQQLTDFILDCPPGHHVMMRAPNPDAADSHDNKFVLRPYSPFCTNAFEFEFGILVNTNPGGRMTRYIMNLQPGEEIEFRGPIGTFMHEPSSKSGRALMIFSHGVAIAPTISIVQMILDDEDDMTRIYHYSCFENLESLVFRDKLVEFRKFWNFSSKVYLSRQRCDECGDADCEHFKKKLRYKEQIFSHRLGGNEIRADVEVLGNGLKEVVICGSKHFQEFVQQAVAGCGVNKEYIFVL